MEIIGTIPLIDEPASRRAMRYDRKGDCEMVVQDIQNETMLAVYVLMSWYWVGSAPRESSFRQMKSTPYRCASSLCGLMLFYQQRCDH